MGWLHGGAEGDGLGGGDTPASKIPRQHLAAAYPSSPPCLQVRAAPEEPGLLSSPSSTNLSSAPALHVKATGGGGSAGRKADSGDKVARSLASWLTHFGADVSGDGAGSAGSGASAVAPLSGVALDAAVAALHAASDDYIIASHLLWALWGLIQARVSDVDFDFEEYGMQRWRQVRLGIEGQGGQSQATGGGGTRVGWGEWGLVGSVGRRRMADKHVHTSHSAAGDGTCFVQITNITHPSSSHQVFKTLPAELQTGELATACVAAQPAMCRPH